MAGGTVIACESFMPMAKLARKVIAANKVTSIRVVCKRSDELVLAAPGELRQHDLDMLVLTGCSAWLCIAM